MLTMVFPGFRITDVSTSGNTTCVQMQAVADVMRCPACRSVSHQVHSVYVRVLRDLPALGQAVEVKVLVRRFRCRYAGCQHKTFAEPLGALAVRHAQRTLRATSLLQALALVTSSYSATRLAEQIGIRTSPRSVLRAVQDICPLTKTPRVLGVDDFALRRGRTYGTLLCDLENGRPIDVLVGRTAGPLARWLREHPGVEVVVRDRATAYADAVREGAPNAIQVADRFHLVRNVTEALREVYDQQLWALPHPKAQPVLTPEPEQAAPLERPSKQQQARLAADMRRRHRYEEIQQACTTGKSLRSIAKETGWSRHTVRKYAQSAAVPVRAIRKPVPRNVDPFVDYLGDRWRSGCHNARQLFREVAALGYGGCESNVRNLLRTWRTRHWKSSDGHTHTTPQRARRKDVRWAILCPPERLRPDQTQLLTEFFALHPDLQQAHHLVQTFRQILRDRRAEDLKQWLSQANRTGLAPFVRLARTFTQDYAALHAAASLEWSTGLVEGQITRVKLVKRIGYGKAGHSLLRSRIIGMR